MTMATAYVLIKTEPGHERDVYYNLASRRRFTELHPVTGLLILLGILVNSRIAALMALLGGGLSILTATLFGQYEPILRTGVMSFNPILTAIALGGFYLYSIVTLGESLSTKVVQRTLNYHFTLG